MEVSAEFNMDHSRVIWRLNGCLETYVTRAELVENSDYQNLLTERLVPLLFLSMPVHDNPKEDAKVAVFERR